MLLFLLLFGTPSGAVGLTRTLANGAQPKRPAER